MNEWRDWVVTNPDSALVLFGVITSGLVTLGGAVIKLYSLWKSSKGALDTVVDSVHKNEILESGKVLTGAAAQIKEDVSKTMATLPPGQKKAIESAVALAKDQWWSLKTKYSKQIAETKIEREKRKAGVQ